MAVYHKFMPVKGGVFVRVQSVINCIIELNSQKNIHLFTILLIQLEQIIIGSHKVQWNYGGENGNIWKRYRRERH